MLNVPSCFRWKVLVRRYTECPMLFQMRSLLAVLVLFVACIASAEEENARLLASKNILNQLLVEGKDLTVEYTIFNVGGR